MPEIFGWDIIYFVRGNARSFYLYLWEEHVQGDVNFTCFCIRQDYSHYSWDWWFCFTSRISAGGGLIVNCSKQWLPRWGLWRSWKSYWKSLCGLISWKNLRFISLYFHLNCALKTRTGWYLISMFKSCI